MVTIQSINEFFVWLIHGMNSMGDGLVDQISTFNFIDGTRVNFKQSKRVLH